MGLFGTLGDLVYGITAEDKTKAGVDSASKGAGKLNASWGEVATTGLGVAGIAVGVGAALWANAGKAAEYADRLNDLTRTTGMSTDSLQELRYIVGQTGGDFDAVATAVEMMVKNIGEVSPGADKDAEAMTQLGVAWQDTSGKMLPTETVFANVVEALGSIEDPAKRNALAFDIFGRGYKGVMELVGTSTPQWNAMADAAHKAGLVISQEDLAAAESFKATQDEVNATMAVFSNELGVAIMPLLKELPGLLEAVKPAIDGIAWVLKNAVAFTHLVGAGVALLTGGGLEGAGAEFEKGRQISQGTGTQINVAAVNLAKGDTLQEYLDREGRVQKGVPTLP
jgi:hypothetical protein